MGASEQILERFLSLSPKLQVAARFVVDHPNEVVIASMRTLAERAGAQPATLVRLAQQLGYAGWPELKSAFAEDMGLHTERYGQRAKKLAGRGREADLVGELFAVHRQNLASTQALYAGTLREAARMLKRAQAVHVAGFRGSFPVAFALFYGYRLFRDSIHLVNGQSGGLEAGLRPFAATVMPNSRAVFRLITTSKVVGCSNGRSPALAPAPSPASGGESCVPRPAPTPRSRSSSPPATVKAGKHKCESLPCERHSIFPTTSSGAPRLKPSRGARRCANWSSMPCSARSRAPNAHASASRGRRSSSPPTHRCAN